MVINGRVSVVYGEDHPSTTVDNRNGNEAKAPTPEEGVRLIRAFLQLEDEALRSAIVKFVEELSGESGAIVRRTFLQLLSQLSAI